MRIQKNSLASNFNKLTFLTGLDKYISTVCIVDKGLAPLRLSYYILSGLEILKP